MANHRLQTHTHTHVRAFLLWTECCSVFKVQVKKKTKKNSRGWWWEERERERRTLQGEFDLHIILTNPQQVQIQHESSCFLMQESKYGETRTGREPRSPQVEVLKMNGNSELRASTLDAIFVAFLAWSLNSSPKGEVRTFMLVYSQVHLSISSRMSQAKSNLDAINKPTFYEQNNTLRADLGMHGPERALWFFAHSQNMLAQITSSATLILMRPHWLLPASKPSEWTCFNRMQMSIWADEKNKPFLPKCMSKRLRKKKRLVAHYRAKHWRRQRMIIRNENETTQKHVRDNKSNQL